VKLLVDNNLPPKLARGLGALFDDDHVITHIKDKFGTGDLKDEDWIVRLGDEGGWAVLSADMNIARKKPSRDLFVSVGLVGFFFSPAMQKWPLHRQAARVLTLWPQMISHMTTTANGVFEVPASGTKFRTIGR
jgi:hypothetical protein